MLPGVTQNPPKIYFYIAYAYMCYIIAQLFSFCRGNIFAVFTVSSFPPSNYLHPGLSGGEAEPLSCPGAFADLYPLNPTEEALDLFLLSHLPASPISLKNKIKQTVLRPYWSDSGPEDLPNSEEKPAKFLLTAPKLRACFLSFSSTAPQKQDRADFYSPVVYLTRQLATKVQCPGCDLAMQNKFLSVWS